MYNPIRPHSVGQFCLASCRAMSGVAENIRTIRQKVESAYESSPKEIRAISAPRLVAVSKTKPVDLIIEAYNEGQRVFGENYVQELCEKSVNEEILKNCPNIKWHFIGNCQSQKAKRLMQCPNLCTIETVTSEKLARLLNKQAENKVVDVFVQINTSGEENKNGLDEENGVKLAQFIVESCPQLKLTGLMTIGQLGNSIKAAQMEENPDFIKLRNVRKATAAALQREEHELELSMGMSTDFEEAIRMGSTNVRVGSSIFGARDYPPKPAATPPTDEQSITHKLEEKLVLT